MRTEPTSDQMELLMRTGTGGRCRMQHGDVGHISELRRAGLVELDDEGRYRLTLTGAHWVAAQGGKARRGSD